MSGFTNYKGVYQIIRTDEIFIRHFTSVITAIIIAGVLILLGNKISENKTNKIYWFGYLSLVIISIFFNFNYFYSSNTSENLITHDTQKIQTYIIKIREPAINEIDIKLNYTKSIFKCDSIRKQLNTESTRADRPGKKSKYYEMLTKYYIPAQTDSLKVSEKFSAVRDEINSICDESEKSINQIVKNPGKFTDKVTVSILRVNQENYNKVIAIVQGYSTNFKYDELKIDSPNIESPNYSLQIISKLFSEEDFSANETSALIISFIFSFLFDIVIVLVLIMLGKERNQSPKWPVDPFYSNRS